MFDAAKELCDTLITHQVTDETSADFGGILCPAHRKAHVRGGEAVFPFSYFYSETRESKYIQSALGVIKWLSKTQNDDGSWGHDSADVPKGVTVFLTTALCHAYQVIASELKAEERAMVEKMIHKAAEFVYRTATLQWAESGGPGINCFVSSCPALQLAYTMTGEEKYRDRAKDNALSGIEQINEDGFLVGERMAGSGGSVSAVDVACNLEVGLGSLVVYSCLSGNEEVRDAVLKALETHLHFITPSGYIDDSWGTRMCQWTLLGNKEGNGCQTALLPLRSFDARFQRAAGQNLRYMTKNVMKDGLVTTGPHARDNADFVPCIQPTIVRANTVCQTLIYCYGVPLSQTGKSILPAEEKGWVRFYRSVNILQVRTSALLCTITGYGAGESEGGTRRILPTGGTISHLWQARFGTVQAASRGTNYGVDARNMNEPPATACLTPRVEAVINGEVFSNLFESHAVLSPRGDSVTDDRFELSARGRLLSAKGEDSGLIYIITYRFHGGTISKEIAVEGARDARLRSVEPVVFARGCDLIRTETAVEIRHPRGSSCIVSVSGADARIEKVSRDDVVWNSFPALYALPIVIEPTPPFRAPDPCKISYTIDLRDWE